MKNYKNWHFLKSKGFELESSKADLSTNQLVRCMNRVDDCALFLRSFTLLLLRSLATSFLLLFLLPLTEALHDLPENSSSVDLTQSHQQGT